jgi:anti-sigma-K factor RskA
MDDETVSAPEASSATVEEIQSGTEPLVVVETAPDPPRDELEVGYRYGQLEARLAALELRHEQTLAQLAAFESATIQAVEQEAAELEQQAEVLADVAEVTLPQDHEAANTLNPEHQAHKPKFWESFFGGHHRP